MMLYAFDIRVLRPTVRINNTISIRLNISNISSVINSNTISNDSIDNRDYKNSTVNNDGVGNVDCDCSAVRTSCFMTSNVTLSVGRVISARCGRETV